MQEGIFTKIGAIATVIGVLGTWFSAAPLQEENDPPEKRISIKIDIFDKNPLYTISSGASLKVRQDVSLPEYKDVLYIQKGKFLLNKEDVDEDDCVVILKFKNKRRKLTSGEQLKIIGLGRSGPEDREFRHAYIYLKINNDDIDYIKCLGKDCSEQITIGQFRNVMKGIIDVNIPVPKEI